MYYNNEIGKVFYQIHGEKNEKTIIFSHGVGMDHQSFDKQVEALKKEYQVIVWDMPYHGKSDAISKKLPYSKTAADFLIQIMDKHQIEQAVFVGLSLGSLVIQFLEDQYPERVTASIHTSGGSMYPRYTKLLNVLKPFMILTKLYPIKGMSKAFGKHKALTKDTQEYLMKTCQKAGKDAIIHLVNAMLKEMTEGLSKPITKPVYMIYGDHDLKSIRNLSIKWHKRHSGSQLFEIKNAHHILNQDQPEKTNQVLKEILCSTYL